MFPYTQQMTANPRKKPPRFPLVARLAVEARGVEPRSRSASMWCSTCVAGSSWQACLAAAYRVHTPPTEQQVW